MGTAAGIMFLDVKGYSKLKYHELREFHTKICTALSKIIITGEEEEPYLYKKTWGDGVVLVHKDMYKLAIVALELRDYFNKQKYEPDSNGTLNKKKLRCRIAIHFGEFETVDDPIDGGKSCYGKGIILPARLEPVTEAEHVWATKGATQYLYDKQKADSFGQLSWSYVGQVPLPKGFDTTHVWEMLWVGDKDINGKEGSQEDPVVRPNTKARTADSGAEPYVPLSKVEAGRIKALTGKDPKRYNISVCSRDRDWDKCPAKARTVLAISEMERNTQSATEESQIAYWIHEINKSTKRIVGYFDENEESLKWKQIWDLKENIRELFNCFDEFRHDSTWPDAQPWPASFLAWRLRDLGIKRACKISRIFLKQARIFGGFVKGYHNKAKNATSFEPNEIPFEIADCLRTMLRITEDLSIHLGRLGEKRLGTVETITRKAFDAFDRFRFAKHVKRLTNELGSCTAVAGVWSR